MRGSRRCRVVGMLEVACDRHLESPGFGIASQIVIPHKIWQLCSGCLAMCLLGRSQIGVAGQREVKDGLP
jgi:hypothetical protein